MAWMALAWALGGMDPLDPFETTDLLRADRYTRDLPDLTVRSVRFAQEKLQGGVKIWAFRKGGWRITDAVDASTVDWSRLLDNDRVEVLWGPKREGGRL